MQYAKYTHIIYTQYTTVQLIYIIRQAKIDKRTKPKMMTMTMPIMMMTHYCHNTFCPTLQWGCWTEIWRCYIIPCPDTEPPLQSQKLRDGEKSSRRKEHSVTKSRVAVSQTDALSAVAVNIICQTQLATCSRPAARKHQMIHNVTEFRDTWSLLRTKLTDLPNDLCSRTINRRQ